MPPCGEQPQGPGEKQVAEDHVRGRHLETGGRAGCRGVPRLALTVLLSGCPRPLGRGTTPVLELSRRCPCHSWQLQPHLREPGVGQAGGQLLGPQVSSGASARPGHFLCAL